MGRILGIDYGQKRCGVAATDSLQIAVHPVSAVPASELLSFLSEYLMKEDVEKIVFGRPTHADGQPTKLNVQIDKFIFDFSKKHQEIEIAFQDESYTSVEASRILSQTNKKKIRKDKSKLDILSAVLILQRYLKHI